MQFETFKSDGYDYRVEMSAKTWASGYAFPAVEDGRVIKEIFPDKSSGLMVGFIPNLRRAKFADPRVRQAMNYVFNFEELNHALFFDQYERINSYFFGTDLASSGLPEGKELAILESVRDQVPASVFTTPYTNPKVESRGEMRDNLKKALALFKEAGWEPRTEVDEAKLPTGFSGFIHSILSAIGLESDPTRIVMRNDKGEAFEIDICSRPPASSGWSSAQAGL